MTLVTIIMGSEKDLPFCKKIGDVLDVFGVSHTYHIASAHKTPEYLLQLLEEDDSTHVYITVAGRSNALSGMVDAQTTKPVIACPPYAEQFYGMDVLSSLRMPSGVAAMTVLDPDAAALAALKILALHDSILQKKIETYQQQMKEHLIEADKNVKT